MDDKQRTESSWIPKTPLKLTRAEQQPIWKENQSNSPSIPHWLIAGGNSQTSQPNTGNGSHLGNSIRFQNGVQAQNAGDLSNQKDPVHERFDNLGVPVAASNNDSRFYLDLWNRGMSHLIYDDATVAAQTAVHASSQAESSDSSSTFKGLFPDTGHQSVFETYQTLNPGILYPSTPNLTNRADKAKGFVVEVKENKDYDLNKIPTELSEQQKEGQPELVVDISCSNVSKTMVENHEPDMGSCQNIDIKTPQQRPRKKKHRPKVVIEGKPKRNRKPRNTTTTTTPASSEKVNTPKRKYVRRNNVSTVGETETPIEGGSEAKTTPKRKYTRNKEVNGPTMTPPEEGVSGTSSPKYNQTAQRSCRRSLKFEFDTQDACEKSSEKIPLTENPMTSALKPQYQLQSMGKEFEDYLLSQGIKTVDSLPPTEPQYTSNYSNILTQETYGTAKRRERPTSYVGLSDSYSLYSSLLQSNYFQGFSEVPQSKEQLEELSFQNLPESIKKKKTKQAPNSTDHHILNYATAIVNNCREEYSFKMMQVNNSANSGPSQFSKVHSTQPKQIKMEQSNGIPHSYQHSCFTPRRTYKRMPSVDDIVKLFKRLDLSKESNTLTRRRKKALITDPYEYSDKNALVVYRRDQSMIPFDGSSVRSRKRGPRPKVNLDEETARVWTLLLENINSEGIDGTDEEKRKYWEKEREMFGGRVNSFIAKMRLVQGDRRFRPWKGSVVDSVIGVFLTQNVSDHLSSSAFMTMAARFPLKPNSDHTSSSISEINDMFHLGEDTSGEVFSLRNYQELVRKLSESTGTLRYPSSDSSECGPNGQTVISDGDILSSQNSVVSPQNSTDSIVNKKENLTCSNMFFEEESTTSVCFQNASSFVELLQMQEQRIPNNIKFSKSFKETEIITTDQSGLSEESNAGRSSQNSTGISMGNHESSVLETSNGVKLKPRSGKIVKEAEPEVDWDSYRKQAEAKGKRERSSNTMDSADWETVRCTEVRDIAETIKERGMNNRLAERIKDFLNRLIRDHGSLDLEWLRDIPPDKAKEYLLSIRGLGLKSVECIRLLTLHHLAFPVDTNVGRIAVRLGWVPLQPLPESLQLHLLELYPVLETIQKHLWPRLCKLDQRKLYELHYHMITFGKVFCTKSKPNCNACPMRGECRHFASAYASARLALPAPLDKSIVTAPAPESAPEQRTAQGSYAEKVDLLQLPGPNATENVGPTSLLPYSQPTLQVSETSKPIIEEPTTPESEPIIEEPQLSDSETEKEETVTEPEWTQCPIDIEDFIKNDDEIPTIDLNLEVLNQNLQSIMQNVGLQDSEYSKALVVLTPEAASIPMPKLKNINRLRTEHQVYLLPDSHQLLKGLEKREENDPSPYLLAIWAPGETINSIQPPERKCSSEGSGHLCFDDTCFSCSSIKEATSHTVRGTILIPCRTAMRGSFPLNGTYFQVNEVFADHESSLNPIDIPRDWLWNLRRRTVYFGTSIPSIFKGLEPLEIQYCFWKGFVCVRGFDRVTRGPRPLIARLHFPVSRMVKNNKEGGGGAAGTGMAKDVSDETLARAS